MASRVVRGLVAALALTATTALAGCSPGGSETRPTGIDQLVVPTPSPRPQDYVAQVDNAWLGWEPGATTTYDAQAGAVTQRVSSSTSPVAGLAATTLTTTAPGAEPVEDHFAQDRAGNVWWLGREGEWTAGQDGAEAGLWMPAAPRVGDGFRLGLASGTSEEVAMVVQAPVGGSEGDAGGSGAGDELRLEVRSALEPGRVETRGYLRGTGLVALAVTGAAGDDVLWTRDGS